MALRDLIPLSRGREMTVHRGDELNPFLTLHREMNRLFDNVFRIGNRRLDAEDRGQ